MLDHPTLDQLRTLRLDGMAEAFAEMQTQDGTADLTHAEWLGLLIDREATSRETKRFESRMRSARLRHVGAAPEDVDYKTRRGLDKALFQNLLTGKWIADKRNLMITGPCGVGKTWLACALAQANSVIKTATVVLIRVRTVLSQAHDVLQHNHFLIIVAAIVHVAELQANATEMAR